MSSKNKKDIFEQPISVETTILKIDIKTTGDLITKQYDLIPFHPNMSDLKDLSNNNFIFFPSFVKITMKDLEKAGVGNDYQKVFMNLNTYVKLIKYVTGPDKEQDNTLIIDKQQVKNYAVSLAQNAISDFIAGEVNDVITIQKTDPLTEEEIITNNIELIKKLFLPVKGHFYILGNDYVIGKSVYNPPYKPSIETNKKLDTVNKKIPLAYTVEFELQLLDAANNPDAGDFSRMTCKAKKANIANDSLEIFGTNFGYVPEKKISTPSILNTTEPTKKRQFSKLQKEWEERNKYIKEPENERERIAQENSWTPLQRKMKLFDKKEEDYKKIPPGWVKETDELDNRYDILIKEMTKYKNEIKIIKQENEVYASKTDNDGNANYPTFVNEMINNIQSKMLLALNNTFTNDPTMEVTDTDFVANKSSVDALSITEGNSDTIQTELNKKIIAYKELKEEIQKLKEAEPTNEGKLNIDKQYQSVINNMVTDIDDLNKIKEFLINNSGTLPELQNKKREQNIIDAKYKNILYAEAKLPEKESDLKSLKNREKELIQKRELSDGYNAQSLNNEIAKVQGDIRKKFADIGVIKSKINPAIWRGARESIKTAKDTIETEKTKEEKKLKQETVKDDLKKVKKEIDDLKKELLIAKYKEGLISKDTKNEYEITKKEKESYDKKDKPIDSYAIINENLKTAKSRYLEIYSQLGYYYKIQGEITLLNEDLARFKELKKSFEGEKGEKDKELKKISDELYKLNVTNKKLTIQEEDRTETLNKEQEKLQEKVKKYTSNIETLRIKETEYIKYIDRLKKIPEKNAEEEFKKTIKIGDQQPIETITLTALTSEGGGHLNYSIDYGKDYDINYKKEKYRKTHKNKYKTNTHNEKTTKNMKYRIIRKKTLRKLKKYMRKHKYTR
jgi:hypothetical protein